MIKDGPFTAEGVEVICLFGMQFDHKWIYGEVRYMQIRSLLRSKIRAQRISSVQDGRQTNTTHAWERVNGLEAFMVGVVVRVVGLIRSTARGLMHTMLQTWS